ncbi:radical SAM protein [Phytohabitans rumicis]|uniref:Radical SAM core domain-containing protein n=1 Tax=Phytohabitans rumicis TaxID=1076125 RepID=A0A6V8L385_9ACTN|nr:radical SAM protein [Phytohabitans rumicis]GFJ87165.1 hypothetical protein Prum_008070 [Phytohabitans rumicis]
MHLAEIVRLRLVPTAGLFLALTRRCPLSCAHCSTESLMTSEQYAEEPFRRIVASFTAQCRPHVLYMSGGEPLLRAGLVRDLAETARAAGTRSGVVSGMYFARGGGKLPAALRRAIAAVDHFTASLDEFHEREVSRADVFRALHEIRQIVPAISLQLTGRDPDDPYLADLIASARREFADEVPMLVGVVNAVGRAKRHDPGTPTTPASHAPGGPQPCLLTSWPLVHYDGTVLACCNQELVARTRPAHLVLGDAARDPWPVLRERSLRRHLLRGLRLLGPIELRARFQTSPADGASGGYCGTCVTLGTDAGLDAALDRYLTSATGSALEAAVQRMAEASPAKAFSGRYGSAPHSELVTLGLDRS